MWIIGGMTVTGQNRYTRAKNVDHWWNDSDGAKPITRTKNVDHWWNDSDRAKPIY